MNILAHLDAERCAALLLSVEVRLKLARLAGKSEGASKSSLAAGCLESVSLPGETQPQLHVAAATVEDELVEELG